MRKGGQLSASTDSKEVYDDSKVSVVTFPGEELSGYIVVMRYWWHRWHRWE
jgi:hypothetical protein